MTAIPVLETDRLILRAPGAADLDAETAFWTSDRSKFVGGPKQPHEVWRILATFIGHWTLRGYGMWAIEDKATGAYLGRTGAWHPGEWPEAEIGWTAMPEAEGKGIVFEAATAARDWLYTYGGWTTAISTIDVDNDRSQALAKRLGATYERDHDFPGGYTLQIWRHPAPEAIS